MDKKPRIIQPTPSAYSYPLLIKNLLVTSGLYAPSQEIVYQDRFRMTYRTFIERVHRLASALAALKVGPGDVVAMVDWDSHRYLEAFFAVPMMGAVLHTVNVRLSPEQILYTMNHAQDSVVLVHRDFVPMIEGMAGQLPTVETFVYLGDGDSSAPDSPPFVGEYESLLADAAASYPFPDFDENAMATLFYTTGTTGDPKGCFYSHRQLMLHTLGVGLAFSAYGGPVHLQSHDVYMPLTPMFHVHAWGLPYVATLLGCKQVYPGRFDPARALGLIQAEGVTFSHCVPTILHMLLNDPVREKVDLGRWKVVNGGSAMPKSLAKQAEALGIELLGSYGMSETCPILTISNMKPEIAKLPDDEQLEVRVKPGLPAPLVDLRIVDEYGREAAHDGMSGGRIIARGPWFTQGYLYAPERSEELWQDGWLHTGDVAVMDGEGYVKITDRFKDVIKSGGEWVSSLELENLISLYPDVAQAAVVGVPDVKWGERPTALVVLKPGTGATFSPESLRQFLLDMANQGRLSKWAIPDSFTVVADIPKTSVGKIDKKEIRRALSEGGME